MLRKYSDKTYANKIEVKKMLRIVLVDDEPGALKNLEHIFEELPDVIVAGSYTAGEKSPCRRRYGQARRGLSRH